VLHVADSRNNRIYPVKLSEINDLRDINA